ncbi:MAG: hypothetical protein AAF517_06080 [Planctomycetota bacterium]
MSDPSATTATARPTRCLETGGPQSADSSSRGPAACLPPSQFHLFTRFNISHMTPADYARSFLRLNVLYGAPDGTTGTARGRARTYLNRSRNSRSTPSGYADLVTAVQTANQLQRGRTPPGRVWRIRNDPRHFHATRLRSGTASLKDIHNFLSYVVTYGIQGATAESLGAWCDRHAIGVDCCGFASQYLAGVGAIPGFISSPRAHVERLRDRRTRVEDIRRGDTIVWYPYTSNWAHLRPRSHIAIVQERSGSNVSVAESVGGVGPRVTEPTPFEYLGAEASDHAELSELVQGEGRFGPFFRFTEGGGRDGRRLRPCVVIPTGDQLGRHYPEEDWVDERDETQED